eukprot:7113106-Prymnesium_polylepis.1
MRRRSFTKCEHRESMVGTRFWPQLASICVSEVEAFNEGRGSSAPFPLVFLARMRLPIVRFSFRSFGVQPGAAVALLDMCREPEPFETFEGPGARSLQMVPRDPLKFLNISGVRRGPFGPRGTLWLRHPRPCPPSSSQ